MAIVHSSGFAVAEALDRESVEACRALFVGYQQGLGVSLCFPTSGHFGRCAR